MLLVAALAPSALAGHCPRSDLLPVDLVAFVRRFQDPAFGAAEAGAELGPTASERDQGNGYADLALTPRAGLGRAVLETHRGELIGVQLGALPGARVDVSALLAAWGPGDRGSPPLDSFWPLSYTFQLDDATWRVLVIVQPLDDAPLDCLPIDDAIIRRLPIEAFVPESWTTEADLVAMARLALRAGPLEPVDLYGSFGVFEGESAGVVHLRAVQGRNVAGSTLGRVAEPAEPPEVAWVETAFLAPIPVDLDRLAAAVGATRDGSTLTLPTGELRLVLDASGAVTGARITRHPR
jgi:hypothetical protein